MTLTDSMRRIPDTVMRRGGAGNLTWVATHEAAHAVVQHYFGRAFSVVVNADRCTGIALPETPWPNSMFRDLDVVWMETVVDLAGPLAEKKIRRMRGSYPGLEGDLAHAEILHLAIGHPMDELTFVWYREDTLKILRRKAVRAAIAAVVAEIERRAARHSSRRKIIITADTVSRLATKAGLVFGSGRRPDKAKQASRGGSAHS